MNRSRQVLKSSSHAASPQLTELFIQILGINKSKFFDSNQFINIFGILYICDMGSTRCCSKGTSEN